MKGGLLENAAMSPGLTILPFSWGLRESSNGRAVEGFHALPPVATDRSVESFNWFARLNPSTTGWGSGRVSSGGHVSQPRPRFFF